MVGNANPAGCLAGFWGLTGSARQPQRQKGGKGSNLSLKKNSNLHTHWKVSQKKPQTIQRAPRPSFPQWRQTELSPCEGAWFGGLIAGISPAIIAQGVIQPLSNNEKACTAVGGHLPLGEGCLDGPRGLCSSSPGHSFQALSPPLDRRQGRGFRLPSQRAKGIVPGTRCGAVSGGGGGGHGLFFSSLDISFPRRF